MLLSIIIPTKDRYHYLKECITTVLSVNTDDFELIIQDNTADNSEIRDFCEAIRDSRLKYFHYYEPLSVVDNLNKAIENSCGRYVCFIGDDDSISSSLIDAVCYIDRHDIDCLSFYVSGYNWPDMEFAVDAIKDARLFFNKDADGSIVQMNPMIQLKKALKDTISGLPYQVPRLYHGVVSRRCLDKVHEIARTYTPGPSPDMAGAVSISLVARSAVFIRAHLVISGFGHKSARGEGKRKAHQGRIEDKPWLPKNQVELWDNELPKYFSGETILAQSAFEAFCAMKKPQYIKWIQYGNVYTRLFKHHKEVKDDLIVFMFKKPVRLLRFAKGLFEKLYLRIKRIVNPPVGVDEFNEMITLTEAVAITNKRNATLQLAIYDKDGNLQ